MSSSSTLDPEKIVAKVERGAEERYKHLKEADAEAAKSADILECFLCESQRLLLQKFKIPAAMICPGEFDCSLCHSASNACGCDGKSKTTLVDIGQYHLSPSCLSKDAPYPLIPYINPTTKITDGSLGYLSLCGCPIHIQALYMCSSCRNTSDWKDESKGTVRVRHRANSKK